MAKRSDSQLSVDHARAARLLREHWRHVTECEAANPDVSFVDDELARSISKSVNHDQVTYRFCLPTQVLAKELARACAGR